MNTLNSDKLIIERAILLKDQPKLVIIEDNYTQSSYHLVSQIVSRGSISHRVFISFETISKPAYLTKDDLFLDCCVNEGLDFLISSVSSYLTKIVPSSSSSAASSAPLEASIAHHFEHKAADDEKIVVIIDSLNHLSGPMVTKHISSIMRLFPFVIIATYHCSLSLSSLSSNSSLCYPSTSNLLRHIASNVFEVAACEQDEQLDNQYFNKFLIPTNLNRTQFLVKLTKFKKSGRKTEFSFFLDTESFTVELAEAKKEQEEESEMMRDLATFNLATTDKQKQAKNQVELPYMDAQQFGTGGAIVYQYEKDDDYDEEDPYEDPF